MQGDVQTWSDYGQNSVVVSPLGHFTGLVQGVAVIPLYLLTFATNWGVQSHCWQYVPKPALNEIQVWYKFGLEIILIVLRISK